MDKEKVYLVQTDTTVGFSSSNDEKLSNIKQRPIGQKILQTVDSFYTLSSFTRVPKKHRKKVRHSKKTTFIYPNGNSYRVISNDSLFFNFIKKFNSHYSTSANLTGKNFDEGFAKERSDIIVLEKEKFNETTASSIYKLTKTKKTKIR